MLAGNLAPNGAVLGSVLQGGGSVDESDLLAKVEVSLILVVDTVDLEKVCVVVGVTASPASRKRRNMCESQILEGRYISTAPLESQDGSLNVQLSRLLWTDRTRQRH
jgi:hypothetical protein